MKPEELRIGNKVCSVETDQVGTITCVHNVMGVIINNSIAWIPFDKIKPVEVNEQILISFGFIKRSDKGCDWWQHQSRPDYFWHNFLGGVTYSGYYSGAGSHCGIDMQPLRYAHQLQNFYHALTFKELPL